MSTSFRRQDVVYNMNKVIITCCDCGMQFILEAIVVSEDGYIYPFDQGMTDFCPYCGKDQRK